jgi:uncharacterized Zn finger protein
MLQCITSINPIQIQTYLLSNGWIEEGKVNEIASIWHRSEVDKVEFEILLPENKSLKDFIQRIIDLVQVLSVFEDRKSEDILNDI